LEPLLLAWGKTHLCIAPDTPGFGNSEPLPEGSNLQDFARALLGFMETIRLARAPIYGVHTGAVIAAAAAGLAPTCFSAVVLHGFPNFDQAAVQEIRARYFAPFRADWSGQHLAWLWSRLREQRIFFPWYDTRETSRVHQDLVGPAVFHEEALDFLRAGDHYRIGYATAFEGNAAMMLGLSMPILLVAAEQDVLSSQIPSLSAVRPDAEACITPDSATAERHAFDFIARHDDDADDFTIPAGSGGFLDIDVPGFAGRLHYRAPDPVPSGLLLHQPGGCAETAQRLLAPSDPVVALDLPGHGFSDAPINPLPPSVWLQVVREFIKKLQLRHVKLVTVGVTAALARPLLESQDVAAHLPLGHVKALNRADAARRLLPDLVPDASGAYLVRAWQMIRDSELFDPWYEPLATNIIDIGNLDPAVLARHHLALLEAPAAQALVDACMELAAEHAVT